MKITGKVSKKENVYTKIREMIVTNQLRPGEIITEADLAEFYQTSKTPVREALVVLANEKLVTTLPRTGYMVTPVTVKDVIECFQMREILEVAAVGLAIEQLTPHQISLLLDENQTLLPVEDGIECNRNFHHLIAEATGNSRLELAIKKILSETERFLYLDPNIVGKEREHTPISKAIQVGDVETAQEMMRKHIRQARSRILGQL